MSLSLKQWRLIKGYSQSEMADRCNVHVNTYRAWEEKPENVTIKNAVIISKALAEPIDRIFFKD